MGCLKLAALLSLRILLFRAVVSGPVLFGTPLEVGLR